MSKQIDMMAMSRWPEPRLPPFLDDEMIYLNKILKEVYIFESDGVWNQETVGHPKLALEARLNEGDWFDRWTMIWLVLDTIRGKVICLRIFNFLVFFT